MIGFLKNWALSIVTVLLFLVMVEIMMPSGNTKKYVNLVAGFILLLAVIRPVTEVITNDFKFSETFYKDSSFLERSEMGYVSRELEEEQREQVLMLYRERLINMIERAVLEIEGINGVSADLIINEDYESGSFGEVRRVYLEMQAGNKAGEGIIEVERIKVGDTKPQNSMELSSQTITRVKEKVGRIANVDECDVVVSIEETQGGE